MHVVLWDKVGGAGDRADTLFRLHSSFKQSGVVDRRPPYWWRDTGCVTQPLRVSVSLSAKWELIVVSISQGCCEVQIRKCVG